MVVVKFIWSYLVIIFPFCVFIIMSLAASDLAKVYYYDLQKYKLLRELHWISYAEKDIDYNITKNIGKYLLEVIVCAALLIGYYFFVAKSSTVMMYIMIIGVVLYGSISNSGKNTTMDEFLKKYNINIQHEELKNGTGHYRSIK